MMIASTGNPGSYLLFPRGHLLATRRIITKGCTFILSHFSRGLTRLYSNGSYISVSPKNPNMSPMRYAICYVSTRTNDVSEDEIKELLQTWKKENSRNEVKGLLLYSEGNFFQVLEGEKDLILNLFAKIKADGRHKDLMQIVGREITQGSYDDYVTDYLDGEKKMRSGIVSEYLHSVKGMEPQARNTIKGILDVFIDTRVL